ncbi:MAG: DNA-binding protein [Candidatus Dormibacteria bacterium]
MRRGLDYKADLLEDLRNDPGYAAAYLSAAISDSQEAFLVALRDVAEARIGLASIATETQLNRENLYRMLSDEGNPRFSSLNAVLKTLRLRITVEAEPAAVGSTAGYAGRSNLASAWPAGLTSTFKLGSAHETNTFFVVNETPLWSFRPANNHMSGFYYCGITCAELVEEQYIAA